jgi:hypothetical protein
MIEKGKDLEFPKGREGARGNRGGSPYFKLQSILPEITPPLHTAISMSQEHKPDYETGVLPRKHPTN